MRAWMIGALLGTLWSGFQPQVPSTATLQLAALVGIAATPARGLFRGFSGALVGYAWASANARQTLQHRLPTHCVGRSLVVNGRVRGLPRESEFRQGVKRQRFELALSRTVPVHCAGPRTLMLSFYGEQRVEPGGHYRPTIRLPLP